MGRLFCETLNDEAYCCANCGGQIGQCEELASTQSHAKYRGACVFYNVSNVQLGPREDKYMSGGPHVVREIFCSQCMFLVGWKCEKVQYSSQKCIEGLYILKRSRLLGGKLSDVVDD